MSSSSSSSKTEAAPLFAREVIALYAEALPEVRFPDLDLASLERAAEELHEAQLAVATAAAQLEAAREAARARAELLCERAQRALAYARVFASGDAALSARVAEVGRHDGAPQAEVAAPKKRGRPKKANGAASLFSPTPGSGTELASESVGT
jgi:hypothetical protein